MKNYTCLVSLIPSTGLWFGTFFFVQLGRIIPELCLRAGYTTNQKPFTTGQGLAGLPLNPTVPQICFATARVQTTVFKRMT